MREVTALASTTSPSRAWAAAKAASPSSESEAAAKRRLHEEEAPQDFVIAAVSGSAAGAPSQAPPTAPGEAAPDGEPPIAAATPAAPAPAIPAPAAAEQSPPAVVEALSGDEASPAGEAAAAEALPVSAQPARLASLHRSPAVSHAVRSLGPVAESSPAIPPPPLPTLAYLPQAAASAASPAPARSMSLTRQLSRKLSRGMSRLRASIRRHLRRADSPPVPRSRDLSGRGSPTSGAGHLPAIPETAPAAVGSGNGLGAEPEMAALPVAHPQPAAAGAVGPSTTSPAPAVSPATAVTPAAAAVEAASQASRASLVEVDLSEPRAAPSSSPSRRRGLACACFARGRPMQ